MTEKVPTAEVREQQGFLRWLVETAVLVGLAFLIAMTIRAAVAEAFEVPSASMEPTIMTNDRILAEKISPHMGAPKAGEVVVVKNPVGGTVPFVKRVIALPGQTVDLKDGAVLVDGKKLTEPYTHGLPSFPLSRQMPVKVPAGYIWVMGDNRTDSGDSRVFGAIPISSIIGRVIAVYWPPREIKPLSNE